jgi:serine/threonine-protein kinase
MPLAPGAVVAGYTVIRVLGSGGMGEVYLARHPRLPRRDALKILPAAVSADREFRERFSREADLAATLFQPRIGGVHDGGEHDDQLWISMDYIEGTDAARLARDRYPAGMPADEVVEICHRRRERVGLRSSARRLTPRRQTRQHLAHRDDGY